MTLEEEYAEIQKAADFSHTKIAELRAENAALRARVEALEGALEKVGCLDSGQNPDPCTLATPMDLCVVCAVLAPPATGETAREKAQAWLDGPPTFPDSILALRSECLPATPREGAEPPCPPIDPDNMTTWRLFDRNGNCTACGAPDSTHSRTDGKPVGLAGTDATPAPPKSAADICAVCGLGRGFHGDTDAHKFASTVEEAVSRATGAELDEDADKPVIDVEHP